MIGTGLNQQTENKEHSDARVPDDIWACTLGATSKIQPHDVAFHTEFKKNVGRLTTEHLFVNPEQFMSRAEK